VNLKDPQVKRSTWMAVSNTVALLCAVLIYDSLLSFLVVTVDSMLGTETSVSDGYFFVHSTVPTCAAPSSTSHTSGSHSTDSADTSSTGHRRLSSGAVSDTDITVSCVLYVLLFTIAELGFLYLRSSKFALGAWAAINAHIVGFAGMGFFGVIQQVSPFCENWGTTLTPVLMAATCMCLAITVVGSLRYMFATKADWESDEEMEEFLEICAESEDDSIAFCLGFLISVTLRFTISGVMPSLHDLPIGKTAGEVFALGGVGFLSILAVILFGMIPTPEMRILNRIYHSLVACLTMTAGWCAVYFSQWFFWWASDGYGVLGEGNTLSAALVLVFFCTVYAIAMTLFCDYLGDNYESLRKGMRMVLISFVLLTGLSWESVFLGAASAIDPSVSSAFGKAVLDLFEVVVFCLVIMPAWIWYILPHTLHDEEEEIAEKEGEKDLEHGGTDVDNHLLYTEDDDPNAPIIHNEVSPHAREVRYAEAGNTAKVVQPLVLEELQDLPGPYDQQAHSRANAPQQDQDVYDHRVNVPGSNEPTVLGSMHADKMESELALSETVPIHYAPSGRKRGNRNRAPPMGTTPAPAYPMANDTVPASALGRKIDLDDGYPAQSSWLQKGVSHEHQDDDDDMHGPIRVTRKKKRRPPGTAVVAAGNMPSF